MKKRNTHHFLTYIVGAIVGLVIGFFAVKIIYSLQYGSVHTTIYRIKPDIFSVENIMIIICFGALGVLEASLVIAKKKLKTRVLASNTLQKELTEKDKFLVYAGHVLRTPATALKWGIESFLDREYGDFLPEQEVMMKKLYNHTNELLNLIEDYINFSKLKIHVLQLSLSLVSVKSIEQKIKSISQTHARRSDIKNITITCTNKSDIKKLGLVPFMMIDQMRLLHSIESIIENAVDYNDPEGQVTIETLRTENNFLVTVSDTGIGISDSDKEKIFSEFFRSKKARQIKSVGSGVGLFLVKLIVEGNNGKVWFESVENKGTTFYVSIPLCKNIFKPEEKNEVILKNI